jgi:hypothetical protein
MKKSLFYYYAGFPKVWGEQNYLENENPMKIEKIENFLSSLSKDKVYLITKNLPLLLEIFFKRFPFLKEIRGYYFPDLFSAVIKNEIELYDIVFPNYVFFYGIGKEAAVNKEFAGQLLLNLIDKAQKQGSYVFLEGVTKSNIQNVYKIDLNIHSITL